VWYDPSDFASMTQDRAGTTPVTAVGQTVGRRLDKSGRGNHWTASSDAARPRLQQDGAGKYYVQYDGVDDGGSTGSIDFTATDKMTLITGGRKEDNTLRVFAELSPAIASNNGSFVFYTGLTSSRYWIAQAKGTAVSTAGATLGSGVDLAVIAATFDIAGDANSVYKNGAFVETSPSDLGTGNFGNYALFLGARNAASLRFNGRDYGFILRGAMTSGATLTSAITWMNSKTGAY